MRVQVAVVDQSLDDECRTTMYEASQGTGTAMRILVLVATLVSVQCGCSGRGDTGGAAAPAAGGPADEIMRATISRYATCSSYEDTGEYIRVAQESQLLPKREIHFRTLFERRTGGFAFTFADADGTSGAIWRRTADPVRWWWSLHPQVLEASNISYPLATFTGITGGVASEIPPLLLQIPLRTDAQTFYRESDETVQGVPCYILLSRRDGEETRFWIEKSTHSVRRVRIRSIMDLRRAIRDGTLAERVPEQMRRSMEASIPFQVEETIDYNSVFDRPMAPATFEQPPRPSEVRTLPMSPEWR